MKLSHRALLLLGAMCLLPPDRSPAQQRENTPRLTLRVRPVVQIGGDFAPEAYSFHDIAAIGVSRTGDVYVLDRGDVVVKVFDRGGQARYTIGREGSGPGEFTRPLDIQVDSVVRVFDGAQQRVSTFALAGVHLRTERIPAIADLPVAMATALRGGGMLVFTSALFSPGQPEHHPTFRVVFRGPDGRVQPAANHPSGIAVWNALGETVPWGVIETEFGRGGAVGVLGDSLVATVDGYTGEAVWHMVDASGLRPVRRDTLTLASRAVTRSDLSRAEEAWRADQEEAMGRIEIAAPTRWSIASRVLFDSDGALWVRSSLDSAEGHPWSVFMPDGTVRVIRLSKGFDLRLVDGNRLYGVEKTVNDSDTVRVLEWEWIER